MHIEINAIGLRGSTAIAEYQSNMSSFIDYADKVVSSFKAVSSSTYALNGGIGSLQSAVNDISSRVQSEIQKKNDAIAIQKKSNDFFDLAVRVDNQVSLVINQNKEEFYRVNPWLKPVISVEREIPWYEQTWSWLCGAGETIAGGAKALWNWASDTAVKVWNSIIEFYQEHKKVIDTVLIVIGAVVTVAAVIVTGGVALVPLLGALGVSTTIAIAISSTVAVIAVVSTSIGSVLNLIDVWYEIDNPIFNTFQKAINVVSAITNLAYSVGNIYNSFKGITPEDYIVSHPSQNSKTGTITFDDNIVLGQDKFSYQRYYSKGNHYDAFNEFWESGSGDYSYVCVDNPQVEFVNSRDIEGVFLSDTEVKNPNIFWNKRYSRKEYLDYVSNGGINNTPVEVTKVNDLFYYFNEDGRHRIIAAQELNTNIPVIIKGLYIKK